MRIITNYPKYLITEDGRVFSMWVHSKNPKGLPKEIKPYPDSSGYLSIRLTSEPKKGKMYKIHRLVAMMYLPKNSNETLQIDHIDSNKLNNHYSNLRWITQKANLLKKYREDGYKTHFAKRVEQRTLNNQIIGYYPSALDAAKAIGGDASAISKVCRGEMFKSCNYKWRYA